MPIYILPSYIANKLAANEFLENPTSIIKELIENSLDAKSNIITIFINKGGNNYINICDNGNGIKKKEILLALERYSTSKIKTLDDLKLLKTMGFRGEALASIKSISRFKLTSRTINQNEAWQVYFDDKTCTLKPAAHPFGTTVEIFDLFYNNSAKKKKMRSANTELFYIDKLIRKFALTRFDVTFILYHNNKMIRKYIAVKNKKQYKKRLSLICGSNFVKNAIKVNWKNEQIAINGWILSPEIKNIPLIQYSYVNLRIIHNKLINHAIRQAYQNTLNINQKPSFILFIKINSNEIDINVHPSKTKIHFYEPRIIHGFIYNAILNILNKNNFINIKNKNKNNNKYKFKKKNKKQYPKVLNYINNKYNSFHHLYNLIKNKINLSLFFYQQRYINNLFFKNNKIKLFDKIFKIINYSYALIEKNKKVGLISLFIIYKYLIKYEFLNSLSIYFFLIPILINLNLEEIFIIKKHKLLIKNIGLGFYLKSTTLIIYYIPLCLHKYNLNKFILDLLKYIKNKNSIKYLNIIYWIICWLKNQKIIWNYYSTIKLINQTELFYKNWVNNLPKDILIILSFKSAIKILNKK